MIATFDRHDTGNRAADWAAFGFDDLPSVRPRPGRLVVLAAHPDDESLGCGGLLSASARLGAKITVIVASDGERSHPQSPTHGVGQLAQRRRAEVAEAVARLAPEATLCCLGLPDGRLSAHADTLDAALGSVLGWRGCDRHEGPVLLVTPWHADRHPDHDACAQAGARLAAERHVEHWEYPIWAWHWADPAGEDLPRARLRRLALSAADQAARSVAIGAYVSQTEPLSALPGDEAVLSAAFLEHFAGDAEIFAVTAPTSAPGYFDELYAASEDPWGLADRFYERRKRAALLASLPRERFARVFEPGCAIGLLTEQLAERCAEVVAWDVADAALAQTQARLGRRPATLRIGRIPHEWPDGIFDLVVLSEVGYYCEDLTLLRERVLAGLSDDGVVVGCHWRHPASDHPHRAEEVHDVFDRALVRTVHHEEPDFLLDVWTHGGASIAEAEGIC